MSKTAEKTNVGVQQFATFYVSDILLGIAIDRVREINRLSEITCVPHAPTHVLGVVNLRGEVVPLLDLGLLLGLAKTQVSSDSKNMIVQAEGQLLGLVVDRVSDILTVSQDDMSSPPANVNSVDGRMILGIHTLPEDVVILLDIDQALANSQ
ncbi:Chemotaxis protein CheW [Rosistilla oblonga]|uniref:Chemotaxis protein CheW n=1 Tax=Rosistilla oblonga TaxID=2527990 RepID=A0A518IV44_9BACT|nr:chemotaxis protein CheW [Rosistilla oblonga]QDV14897.1 Chemotaxis protein CheW [Rosistilla oblonga]QDV56948.1 Chemotaxis protein CheW [Rosistilla oblonga]